jgi:farnesyl diphosphate synthase
MIWYIVPGGKLNCGFIVVHSLQALTGDKPIAPETLERAAVLGWCIEWLQAFFLVADDIMDASKTRRGEPCWYLVEGVGNIAINDAFILQANLYTLLKRYFKGHPAYLQLLELFTDVTFQTELGQLMDLTSNPIEGPTDLDRFTPERYWLIVKYKTAFYSFYLPVACALLLHGTTDDSTLAAARDILVEMGKYFQVQDDFLDCYGTPEQIGKIGTDIQDNKCSWLVVQALAKATPEQRELLKANYGKDDEACIAKVKELYNTLGLKEQFEAYEAESHASLTKAIASISASAGIPADVFNRLLAKIYKRQK